MATQNTKCNDPTDNYAEIFYSRGNFVIFQTGIFPIADLGYYMNQVQQIGAVVVVEQSGPNGTSDYRGSFYDSYTKQFGAWPRKTLGTFNSDGTITCDLQTPPPCPTGSHWDLDSNQCVPDNPAPPSSSPPDQPPADSGGGTSGGGGVVIVPLPIPAPNPPDSNGDEIGECCAQTAQYLYWIAKAIDKLATQGDGANDTCCTNIVAALGTITTALLTNLENIRSAIGHLDYDSVYNNQNLIDAITTSLKTIATPAATDLTPVVTAINELAAALPGPDPNLKRIADDMDKLVSDADPDGDAYVDFLINGGALDASFGPVIKGQT